MCGAGYLFPTGYRPGSGLETPGAAPSLASVVQNLCGVFQNSYFLISFKGGLLVIEEENLMFLLASSGFNNLGFMKGPFEFTFSLVPLLKTSRLSTDPKNMELEIGRISLVFRIQLGLNATSFLEITIGF